MADREKAMLEARKADMQDDRERDKMAQDLAIKVAEILAKSGVQINTAKLKAEQAAPRTMQPNMMGGPNVGY